MKQSRGGVYVSDHKNWELQLNEYIRQGEPDRVDKSIAWKTAIGLQDVDGLKTSDYLIETAKDHIEGKISIFDHAEFSYEGLSLSESVHHISKFAAGIWQIHPFCEGNTRLTAVFII